MTDSRKLPDPRPARLLLVGDVHLGRRPSRVPPSALAELQMAPGDLEPSAALSAAVDWALEEGVDGFLLAGDVVDQDDGYLEAYPPLRSAAERLLERNIAVLAVVGNHDHRVLPRLAKDVPGVRLVGAGGRWESVLIRRGDSPVARVVGWSFPGPTVDRSPLVDYPPPWKLGEYPDGGGRELPTLGLLHCDLDASQSVHAPVRRSQLNETAIAFALGHVHRPSPFQDPRPIGYLGCLSPMDPGEAGPRGPWLAEATAGGWRFEQRHLAPIGYEELAVCAEGARSREDLEERFQRAVDARLAGLAGEQKLILWRLVWTGRRALELPHSALVAASEHILSASPQRFPRGITAVEGWRDETRAALDLKRLAEGSDPVALLAQRALLLEQGGGESAELVGRARRWLSEHLADGRGEAQRAMDDGALAKLLFREALLALEELLCQKDRAP